MLGRGTLTGQRPGNLEHCLHLSFEREYYAAEVKEDVEIGRVVTLNFSP
jgi:hypothetical protein